jgi:hypothetical protein
MALKKRRAKMPYKRLSPPAHTFLVTHFELIFRKTDFFNSYSPLHKSPRTFTIAGSIKGEPSVTLNAARFFRRGTDGVPPKLVLLW